MDSFVCNFPFFKYFIVNNNQYNPFVQVNHIHFLLQMSQHIFDAVIQTRIILKTKFDSQLKSKVKRYEI